MDVIVEIPYDEGVKTSKAFGLDVPDIKDLSFFMYKDCGVFCVRPCQFGGVEVHIAFSECSRWACREASIEMMKILPRPIFAFITCSKRTVINLTLKLGFKDLGEFLLVDSKGERNTRILRCD